MGCRMCSKLIKRIYYGIHLSLNTPLCISNGENQTTDCDVLIDWEGRPFIPGTSFAGAFREFLEETGQNTDVLFGSSDDKSGKMSHIWISDFYFNSEVPTAIRDGVLLENRVAVAKKKYDYEVIEYGSGTLFLQLCIWEESSEKKENDVEDLTEDMGKEMVEKLISGIRLGDIRLGAQKNRGLGKLNVEDVYCREFSKNNVDEWIEFDRKDLLTNQYKKSLDAYCSESEHYVTLRVPLVLTGGLSIRRYSTRKNEPDFVSLMRKVEKNKERTTIPGSSWKGAIRNRIKEIVQELDKKDQLGKSCKQILGFVVENKNGKKSEAKASEWIVSESELDTETFVQSVRNAVSRFENATVKGALYGERFAVGGSTELEIKVKKIGTKNEWFIGLLILVIKDIQKGYLSIGGGAAIGRGVFKSGGAMRIENGLEEAEYMLALHKKLEGEA